MMCQPSPQMRVNIASIARVVAHLGAVLMAKHGDNRASEVENESRAVLRLMNEDVAAVDRLHNEAAPKNQLAPGVKSDARFADQGSWASR